MVKMYTKGLVVKTYTKRYCKTVLSNVLLDQSCSLYGMDCSDSVLR